MKNAVRIFVNDTPESDEMIAELDRFLKTAEDEDNLYFSYVLDKGFSLEKEEYGGYDHLIITNRAWLDLFHVGIGTEDSGGALTEISINDLAYPLKEWLEPQMSILTISGEVPTDGMSFYEFSGKSFLALPPGIGDSNTTVQAKHPLVIVVDRATDVLKTKSMLMPALTSGNIIFTNEDALSRELANSTINVWVSSIDSVAEAALGQAQRFMEEGAYYVLACVLIAVAVIAAGIMNAQLWASMNQKRIFTLHTAGKRYKEILNRPLKSESVLALVAVCFGIALTYVLKHPPINTLLCVAVILALLYIAAIFAAYRSFGKRAFYMMSRRRG